MSRASPGRGRWRRVRQFVTIATFGAAGAVVNVCMAWACALWAPEPEGGVGPVRRWPGPVPSTWPASTTDGPCGSLALVTWKFGLPFRSLACDMHLDQRGWIDDGASNLYLPWLGDSYLPVRCLWPALVIDTAVLGALGWFALFGPRRIRAWRRRRAGACDACGYARTGLTPGSACPECGMSQSA